MVRRIHAFICILLVFLPFSSFSADLLPTPTQHLRYLATVALSQNDTARAYVSLQEAEALAKEQENLYVQANELRYIAGVYATVPNTEKAQEIFTSSMQVASRIPTWNHRLYASIGVLEMQRQTGDLKGVHDNALLAIQSGLLEIVAETGKPAETGRFFTAMSGAMTETERRAIRQRIDSIAQPAFQTVALHKLNEISVRQE